MKIRGASLILAFAAACDSAPPPQGTPALSVAAGEEVKEDFEKENPKWKFAAGKWERRNGVLAHTAETQPWGVAILEDKKFADLDVSVRVKPLSGEEDQTGGIVFRAQDAKTYYLVRSNGLEDNFRLYTVTKGKRRQIASTQVTPPKLGEWHTLRVVAKGPKIQAFIDDQLLLSHEDAAFSEGYLGLWAKADSVTEFDDLEASGTTGR